MAFKKITLSGCVDGSRPSSKIYFFKNRIGAESRVECKVNFILKFRGKFKSQWFLLMHSSVRKFFLAHVIAWRTITSCTIILGR